MNNAILLISTLCLCACAAALFVAVVWFLATKYVNSEARWPGDVEQPAVSRPHLHPVDEDRRTVRVDVLAPRGYVDRLARHYEDWAEAFVKANLRRRLGLERPRRPRARHGGKHGAPDYIERQYLADVEQGKAKLVDIK